MEFKDRLALAMSSAGMHGLDLAKKAGVEDSTISRYINGERKHPRPDTVKAIAQALSVDYQWLATGEGRMRPSAEPTLERRPGSEALEIVLRNFEWPADLDVQTADAVVADLRAEAFSDGKDRPESVWHLRAQQLLRERTGRAKRVAERERPIVSGDEPDPDVAAEKARRKAKRSA